MLDTIRLKFKLSLPRSILRSWKEHRTISRGTITRKGFENQFLAEENNASIKAIYFPNDHIRDSPLLIIEFSLPSILLGNNHTKIENLELALDNANGIISSTLGIPLDVRNGIPIRLDIFYDHQVGESVQPWLSVIGKLEYPRRKTIIYRGEGVTFSTRRSLLKFYDKYQESKDPITAGVLRQELQLRKSEIKRVLGIETLGEVSEEKLQHQLRNELKILNLHAVEIPNPTALLDLLMSHFKRSTAERYATLIQVLQGMTVAEYVSRYAVDPSSLRKDIRSIRNVGIPMAVSEVLLPMLTIS